jgi:hypothetical protein
MTSSMENAVTNLEHVVAMIRAGLAGESEINDLVRATATLRAATPPKDTEAKIVARYVAAREEETIAAAEIAAHFWPLVKAATTEAEGRDILNRVPGGAVEKAFFVDHLVYVSKVIPKVAA